MCIDPFMYWKMSHRMYLDEAPKFRTIYLVWSMISSWYSRFMDGAEIRK